MEEAIKLIGGILGIIAFVWKVYDTFISYLQIDLELKYDDAGNVTALTTVSNKSVTGKALDYALLLIGPEMESPITTARHIGREYGFDIERIAYTNDIVLLHNLPDSDSPKYVGNQRAVIPLPFFYAEQVDIGDETLKYRCSIDLSQLEAGAYSARLFVFQKNRLHRTTQDLFVKPLPASDEPQLLKPAPNNSSNPTPR